MILKNLTVYYSMLLSQERKFRNKKIWRQLSVKINGDFIHSVYEHDRFCTFISGGSRKIRHLHLWIRSQYISGMLWWLPKMASFITMDSMKKHFENRSRRIFKAGKFVRGGSTIQYAVGWKMYISTRKKTVARKAEEALIVWLIESNRLCSKERMYEVYLNIIELWTGIYGIGEAAPFYFFEKPSELNLRGVFSLPVWFPHPKWFVAVLIHIRTVENHTLPIIIGWFPILLRKNLITQEEHDALVPVVIESDPAKW